MVPKIRKIIKIYITRYRFLHVWYRNGTVNLRGFWGKMSPLQRGEEGRRTCVLRPSFGLWCQVKPASLEYQTIFVRSRKWSYREAARPGNQGLYAGFPIPAIWNLPSDALAKKAPFALYGNENGHAEPHQVTRNRARHARFTEAQKGEIRLRGRKKLCGLDKDWICLRFSGLSTGHLFPIFIKIKHFARNRLSWGCSIFRSINLAPELLQWCINIIKYALKYQGIGIPRSFFLSWRKILLI